MNTYTDSCYVYDTVMVGGNVFYRMVGTMYGNYRDSANCILRSDGCKLDLKLSFTGDTLSTSHYNPFVLNGDWYLLHYIMDLNTTTFTHNSKTYFNCISRRGDVYTNVGWSAPFRTMKNIYSPGVGIVFSSYFYLYDFRTFEMKLLRYKVN